MLATLAVLALVLPNDTLAVPGPRYAPTRLVFVAVVSLALYCLSLYAQTVRHIDDFADPHAQEAHGPLPSRAFGVVLGILPVALLGVVRLVEALAASSGPALPFVVPLPAAAGGFFAATNFGSNSILMPVVSALALPLPPAFVAAVQNFTGSALCMIAPMRLGTTAALAADGTTPGAIGRRLWPTGAAAVLVGRVAIAALVTAGTPGDGPA